jgi:hypothetical protein
MEITASEPSWSSLRSKPKRQPVAASQFRGGLKRADVDAPAMLPSHPLAV